MIFSYLIGVCTIAIINTCALAYFFRKQYHVPLALFFFLTTITNFGFLSLALSETFEAALTSMKIASLGTCFLPLFLLFIIIQLSKVDMPNIAKIALLTCSAIKYAYLFYLIEHATDIDALKFIPGNNMSNFLVESPIIHFIWLALAIIFTSANVAVIIYTVRKKMNVSYINFLIFIPLEILSGIVFIIAWFYHYELLIMPLIYVLDEFALLYICLHSNEYDINNVILKSLEKNSDLAFVAFSNKGNYLGCNSKAIQYFPELKNYKVDNPLKTNDQISSLFKELLKNNNEKNQPTTFLFSCNKKYFRLTSKSIKTYFGKRKTLLLIEDETKTQTYIQWLNSSNSMLENTNNLNQQRLHALQEQIIIGMAKMVESRDSNTGGHIKRTSDVVAILVTEMRKDKSLAQSNEFYNALITAAPMHDLGKIAIDDRVLRKPGKFTEQEYAEMKTHALKGATIIENLLSNIETPYFINIAKNVALSHHERFDGKGYPNNLSGNDIPLEARIMAIADVYDALVSKRCYKEKFSFADSNAIIISSMGTQFDPSLQKYYEACREKIEAYYKEQDSSST